MKANLFMLKKLFNHQVIEEENLLRKGTIHQVIVTR